VVGGGHVGKAVVHLAKWLGFRVAVSDDRAEFCTPEAVPGADAYYPCLMAELPNQLKVSRRTFIVVTSRGSSIDAAGLPALLQSQAAYIGVIGSKRRWLTTVKALKEQGVPDELIQKVHSPIGLELNAETPEEIAVSIMAEILLVRNKGTGKMMKE
jgi:xanthine dehydrogenase accessory factor